MEPTKTNLAQLLFQVVKQGTQSGADPEKVRILPETARLLAELLPEDAEPEASSLDRIKQAVAEVMASYGREDVKPIVLHLDVDELARATVRRHRTDKQ